MIDLYKPLFNPNADFYASLFENYHYGNPDNTPILPVKMGHVNASNNIVITEDVYKELLKINSITSQTNQEKAYLIFGEDNYATLNHEITHALQYYCYNDNTPTGFYRTLPNKEKITKDIVSFCEDVILKMDAAMSSFEKPNNNDDLKKLIYYFSINKFGYERKVIDIFDTFMCFTGHLLD